jgi:hypothetical protein
MRFQREAVLIEGGSFLKYVAADYSIMIARPPIRDIKSSAVRVMPKMNAICVNRSEPDASIVEQLRARLLSQSRRNRHQHAGVLRARPFAYR